MKNFRKLLTYTLSAIFILLPVGFYFFYSCNKKQSSQEIIITDLKSKIEELKLYHEWLEQDLKDIRNKASDNYYELSDKLIGLQAQESMKKYGLFSLNNYEGFRTVTSNTGNFFVSLKKITQEHLGYKLEFEIGNPSLVTYNDIELIVKWNRSYESYKNDKDYKQKLDEFEKKQAEYLKSKSGQKPEKPTLPPFWSEQFKEKKVVILKDILPGKWNTAEIYISPVTPEELEHVEVYINTSKLSLY